MTALFRGIIAYPITPFDVNGTAVNTTLLAVLIEQLIEQAHAIAPLGSTGESTYLSEAECQSWLKATGIECRSPAPTFVGIRRNGSPDLERHPESGHIESIA